MPRRDHSILVYGKTNLEVRVRLAMAGPFKNSGRSGPVRAVERSIPTESVPEGCLDRTYLLSIAKIDRMAWNMRL